MTFVYIHDDDDDDNDSAGCEGGFGCGDGVCDNKNNVVNLCVSCHYYNNKYDNNDNN